MSPKALFLAAALASTTAIVPVYAAQPTDSPSTQAPAATAPAMPGQPPVPLREKIMFNVLDRNGDGVIDQDEFNAFAKAVFSAVDTNGDGKISSEEFDKAVPFGGGRPGGPMGQFMRHGPGFGPGFGMDGHHGQRPDWRQQGQNDQGPGGPGGPNGGPGGPAQFGDNQGPQGGPMGGPNGGPQPAQFGGNQPQGGPLPNFASLDKNGDGVLTPDEFQIGGPGMLPPPAPQQ